MRVSRPVLRGPAGVTPVGYSTDFAIPSTNESQNAGLCRHRVGLFSPWLIRLAVVASMGSQCAAHKRAINERHQVRRRDGELAEGYCPRGRRWLRPSRALRLRQDQADSHYRRLSPGGGEGRRRCLLKRGRAAKRSSAADGAGGWPLRQIGCCRATRRRRGPTCQPELHGRAVRSATAPCRQRRGQATC